MMNDLQVRTGPDSGGCDATPRLPAAEWYRALTLAERFELCNLDTGPLIFSKELETARNLLSRWRDTQPFQDPDRFTERLAADGLEERHFIHYCSLSPEQIRERCAEIPDWILRLEELFRAEEERDEDPAATCARANRRFGKMGAAHIVHPIVSYGFGCLEASIASLADHYRSLPFSRDSIADNLLDNLTEPLNAALMRVLILELNVARLRGSLQGETSAERHRDFTNRLCQVGHLRELFLEYPVLARDLLVRVEQWASFMAEFLRHLCEDRKELQERFAAGREIGLLIRAQTGAGDTHRDGRSVIVAEFDSGFRVIYKPRSLSVEQHFGEFLEIVNSWGANPPFRRVQVVDRPDHGWVEFVVTEGCLGEDELTRFYQRSGANLALMYLLDATDFHRENVIASGEHPVLVDLEAILHARFQGVEVSAPAVVERKEIMEQSILRIGMLPRRIWGSAEAEGVDLSALGGDGEQLSPFHTAAFTGYGSDSIKVVRQRKTILASQNRPTLNGSNVDTLAYMTAIQDGFESTYRLLLAHKDELSSDETVLNRFRDDEIRVVVRPTNLYFRMLGDLYHPNCLRDGLERSRLLDRLWAQSTDFPFLKRLIRSEANALCRGDIPMFLTLPVSRDLLVADGTHLPLVLAESGWDLLSARLAKLSHNDLCLQKWFLHASFLTTTPPYRSTADPIPAVSVAAGLKESLLASADLIAEHILQCASATADSIGWCHLIVSDKGTWTIAPVGWDLYGGLSGIALFLTYAARVLDNAGYAAAAELALRTGLRQMEETTQRFGRVQPGLSVMGGESGLLYALAHAGSELSVSDLIEAAETLNRQLIPAIERGNQFDFANGAAGYLCAAAALHAVTRSEESLSAATQCGKYLLKTAQSSHNGIGWPASGTSVLMTGFSHGASGAGYALQRLAHLSGEARFEDAACLAARYEDAQFDLRTGRWRDLRSQRVTPSGSCSWCHGSPGIGLARAAGLGWTSGTPPLDPLRAAIADSLQHGFEENDSLCHGTIGTALCIAEMTNVLIDDNGPKSIDDAVRATLMQATKAGWRCATPGHLAVPGLMTGLAGIGLGLLRLAVPDQVPLVLTLESPPCTKSRPPGQLTRTPRNANRA